MKITDKNRDDIILALSQDYEQYLTELDNEQIQLILDENVFTYSMARDLNTIRKRIDGKEV